jgi:hypothetical protein
MRPNLPVLLAAAALALAACGGGDGGGTTSESTRDNAQDTARTKLEQCLRDQGLDVGGGSAAIGQLSEADRLRLQEAIEGPCAEFREDAVGEVSPAEQQEFEDARTRFLDCLRNEGVEANAGGGLAQLDPDDPEVQDAVEKCQALMPDIGAGPGGG